MRIPDTDGRHDDGFIETPPRVDDGDGAYPYAPTGTDWQGQPYPHAGMSLRDWFAGQALGGIIHAGSHGGASWVEVAQGAYALADAMICARAKR